MPRIIVTADGQTAGGDRRIMFAERVSVSDFESEHFQAQLVERLGWAVGDADAVEQDRWEVDVDDAAVDAAQTRVTQADSDADEAESPVLAQASQRPRVLV
jgi:hypothetical protein